MRSSRTIDGPLSEKRSAVLEDEAAFLGCSAGRGLSFLLDIPFEAFKESLPYTGLGDENIPAIRLVAYAPQIAERAQGVQGARNYGFRDAQYIGKAAHRVRPGGKIDQQHQGHLAVREVGLTRSDVTDQRLHPAFE
jgi:hypothetical protein